MAAFPRGRRARLLTLLAVLCCLWTLAVAPLTRLDSAEITYTINAEQVERKKETSWWDSLLCCFKRFAGKSGWDFAAKNKFEVPAYNICHLRYKKNRWGCKLKPYSRGFDPSTIHNPAIAIVPGPPPKHQQQLASPVNAATSFVAHFNICTGFEQVPSDAEVVIVPGEGVNMREMMEDVIFFEYPSNSRIHPLRFKQKMDAVLPRVPKLLVPLAFDEAGTYRKKALVLDEFKPDSHGFVLEVQANHRAEVSLLGPYYSELKYHKGWFTTKTSKESLYYADKKGQKRLQKGIALLLKPHKNQVGSSDLVYDVELLDEKHLTDPALVAAVLAGHNVAASKSKDAKAVEGSAKLKFKVKQVVGKEHAGLKISLPKEIVVSRRIERDTDDDSWIPGAVPQQYRSSKRRSYDDVDGSVGPYEASQGLQRTRSSAAAALYARGSIPDLKASGSRGSAPDFIKMPSSRRILPPPSTRRGSSTADLSSTPGAAARLQRRYTSASGDRQRDRHGNERPHLRRARSDAYRARSDAY